MKHRSNRAGFTLVELLVVVGIIAILFSVAGPLYKTAIQHANCAGCASHMRGLGIAFDLYANDNDGKFPGRVTSSGNDKWPALLLPYITDPKVYADPGDPIACQITTTNLASNSANNSSFFFNGFNDLGTYADQTMQMGLANITNGTNLILLGQKIEGNTQYYMDFVEGNEDDILNKKAYFGGSTYTFADGSSRFMTETEYNHVSAGSTESDGDKMWLVNQSYVIPPVPSGH